jgi:hypothetical protein
MADPAAVEKDSNSNEVSGKSLSSVLQSTEFIFARTESLLPHLVESVKSSLNESNEPENNIDEQLTGMSVQKVQKMAFPGLIFFRVTILT